MGDKKIRSLVVPESTHSIGPDALIGCDSLKDVTFDGKTMEQVRNIISDSHDPDKRYYPWGANVGCVFHCSDGNITIDQNFPSTYKYVVNFSGNANDARVVPVNQKYVNYNSPYGELPMAYRPWYVLIGWFTEPIGGRKVEPSTKSSGIDETLYAHWRKASNMREIPEIQEKFRRINEAYPVSWDFNTGIDDDEDVPH